PEGGSMSDAREIGARFIDAFNAHDEVRIRELNGENGVFEAPGEVKLEGREAKTGYAMGWLRAFPDARLTVHNEIANGNWIVQECTFEGTHEDTLSSPNGDIPATHKPVNGRCVQLLKIEGDVITDTRLYFDQVDRKSTRLNSSHLGISYAVFCLKKNNRWLPRSARRYNCAIL